MKKLLLAAVMLLGGVSLNAQDGPQISKDDATYTDVDVNGQSMAVHPLWGWYTALGNQSYGIIGANSRGMAISADGSKMLISNRVADTNIRIEVYNAFTGEHIKSVQVSKDIWYRGKTTDADGNEVDEVSGFQANDIQVDAAGNVLLWRMTTNIGVSPAECWAVNLEDGSVKKVLSTIVDGLEGRFDYCGVYGDVVTGDGYILSATSSGDELFGKTVLKWRYVGGELQPQEESDQIFIQEYYPVAASNNYGTRVCPVDENLFYMDAFTAYATLYNMDGTIADSFASIADEEARKAIQPMSAGNNGVAEFSLGGVNYAIYSISNQLDAIPTGLRLVSLNDAMEFSSMKLVYDLPQAGLGNISNPERTVLPRVVVNEEKGIARIVIYCNRGGATAYDFGTRENINKEHEGGGSGMQNGSISTLQVLSTKGEVVLSETADIELYNLIGQKVAERTNTTTIKALSGIYVLKAKNAGNTLNVKVIVE